jgi:HEAT repeat protein
MAALGVLGILAVVVAPLLLEQWRIRRFMSASEERRWQLGDSWTHPGPQAREMLEEWYLDKVWGESYEEHCRATERLSAIGSARVLPELISRSWPQGRPDEDGVKGIIRRDPQEALTVMVEALVAEAAPDPPWFWYFEELGAEAVPALVGVLDHADHKVRAKAAAALRHLKSHASEFLPAVRRALIDPDHQVRYEAVQTLREVGPNEVDLAALAELFEDPERRVRWEALSTVIWNGGRGHSLIVPAARKLLTHPDPQTRLYALFIVTPVERRSDTLARIALELLGEKRGAVVGNTLVMVRVTGMCSPLLIPRLLRLLLEDEDPGVCRLAAEVLPIVEVPPERALPVLLRAVDRMNKMLEKANPYDHSIQRLYEQLFRSIETLHPDGKAEVLRLIRREMKSDRPDVRILCARQLPHILSDRPDQAVPLLLTALHDDNPHVRFGAVVALGDFGKDAQSALPSLEGASTDPDGDVSHYAKEVILKIKEAILKIGSAGTSPP